MRTARAWLAAAAACAGGCSLLVDPPRYEVCTDSHAPRCDGDDLVVCQGDLDVRTTCTGGCDPLTAACVVPTCGNGTTDDGEVCDDENRESGDGCRADCAKVEMCGDRTVDLGEPCDDGNRVDGDGCDCRPPDVLVNTTREGKQEAPAVAAMPQGGALIVWQDESGGAPDTSGLAIRARLVRGTSPVGADLVVNSEVAFDQTDARVAASATGDGFLVVWTDASAAEPDASGTAVRGRLIDADGVPRGPDVVLASTVAGDQLHPAVAPLPDGGFAVAWEDHSQASGDTSGAAIRLRLFDGDGTPAGPDRVVDTTTTLDQTEPTIAVAASGRMLVAWEDRSLSPSDASDSAIRGRRVAAGGAFADAEDFPINTTIARDQLLPRATALASGDFLVVWTDASEAPGDGGNIRARQVPAAGAPAGSDVVLNTTAGGVQEQASPAPVDGAVAVAWEDESARPPDTSESGIRFRWLDADGRPAEAPDQLLNSIVVDDQGEPSIAALASGQIIAVWEDESLTPPDDQADAIRMKVIDPPARLARPRR